MSRLVTFQTGAPVRVHAMVITIFNMAYTTSIPVGRCAVHASGWCILCLVRKLIRRAVMVSSTWR